MIAPVVTTTRVPSLTSNHQLPRPAGCGSLRWCRENTLGPSFSTAVQFQPAKSSRKINPQNRSIIISCAVKDNRRFIPQHPPHVIYYISSTCVTCADECTQKKPVRTTAVLPTRSPQTNQNRTRTSKRFRCFRSGVDIFRNADRPKIWLVPAPATPLPSTWHERLLENGTRSSHGAESSAIYTKE